MQKYISISDAKYLGNFKIKIEFDDGVKQIVDFKHFIFNSNHPDIKKYQDEDRFKDFNITYGDLEWNDYELSFPIYDLYTNNIEKKQTEDIYG